MQTMLQEDDGLKKKHTSRDTPLTAAMVRRAYDAIDNAFEEMLRRYVREMEKQMAKTSTAKIPAEDDEKAWKRVYSLYPGQMISVAKNGTAIRLESKGKVVVRASLAVLVKELYRPGAQRLRNTAAYQKDRR